MITFKQVEIDNFLSLRSASVPLQGFRAPVLVVGQNLDSQSADSNGAGKSAIFEAIVWSLYGQTLRGLAARDVVNRHTSGDCHATVHFTISEEGPERNGDYEVHRSQQRKGGGTLTFRRNGEEIPVKDKRERERCVEEILGVDYQLFCESVVLGQDSLEFAGATDAEKKRILEHVARLECFETFLTETKRRLEVIAGHQQEVEREKAHLEGSRKPLQDQLESATVFAAKFERDRDDRVAELTRKCDDLKGRANEVTQLQESLGVTVFDNPTLADAREELKVAEGGYLEVSSRVAGSQAHLSTLSDLKKQHELALEQIKDVCPTCKRPFDKFSLQTSRVSIQNQVANAQSHIEKVQAEFERGSAKAETARGALGSLRLKVRRLESEKESFDRDYAEMQKALTVAEGAKDRLEELTAEIEVTRAKIDPFISQREGVELRLVASAGELRTCEERLKDLREQERYLNFWVTAFGKKGVRSYVMDGVANSLNKYAVRYSEALTGGEIQVVFTTQRQLTTGKMTEDFQVQGINCHGADVYKGNSVGERQRVDACVSLALRDLIRSRLGSSVNLFVCDEVTANLDQEGSERMIHLLRGLHQEGRDVFYVTHNLDMKDLFSDTIEVSKSGGVSQVVTPTER